MAAEFESEKNAECPQLAKGFSQKTDFFDKLKNDGIIQALTPVAAQ